MTEYYHVVPGSDAYDEAQLALIAGHSEYDLSELGQGVLYMDVPLPEPVVPELPVEPTGRMPVEVYFGDDAVHVVAPGHARKVRWTGTTGRPPHTRREGMPRAVSDLRRVGTVAMLGDPELVANKALLDMWMVGLRVPEDRFLALASALRTWWEHKLRIAGRPLIVADSGRGNIWSARANPDMDFTESRIALIK